MSDTEELKAKVGELEKALAKLSVPKVESKTVYISKDRKLQKFSGHPLKDTDPSVEEWVEDVSYHLKNISGKEAQLEFVYDHLQGQARDEVRTCMEMERDTPDKILQILQDLFQDADSIAQIQQKFFQRDQKPGETLQQYSLTLLKLVDRMVKKGKGVIGYKELMLKERFIDGVSDKQLQREMRRFAVDHPTSDFQAFRQRVLKWVQDQTKASEVHQSAEQVDIQQVEQVGHQKPEPSQELIKMLAAQQEMLEAQQKQINLLTNLVQSTGQPSGYSQPTGYNQRGRGRGQPQPRRAGFRGRGGTRGRGPNSYKCFNCRGEGHYARDCPQANAIANVEEPNLN